MTMQQLDCGHCGRGVLVEKFSAAHTTVQWTDDAADCPRIASAQRGLGDSGRTCDALRSTIDEAVRNKVLVETTIELPEIAGSGSR
ncbi:hypothetical protein D8W71_08195 [Rhodococcus sp. P1Y]|nr:hypothetical protein D8W71_08195 [Rhodococcus sp. P1Y]